MGFVSILSQKSDKIVIFPRNKPFGTLFVIDKSEYNDIKNKLDKILNKDSHYSSNKYSIKTIYFDNIYDDLLNQNINGDVYREKFRIRIYNDDFSNISYFFRKENKK